MPQLDQARKLAEQIENLKREMTQLLEPYRLQVMERLDRGEMSLEEANQACSDMPECGQRMILAGQIARFSAQPNS